MKKYLITALLLFAIYVYNNHLVLKKQYQTLEKNFEHKLEIKHIPTKNREYIDVTATISIEIIDVKSYSKFTTAKAGFAKAVTNKNSAFIMAETIVEPAVRYIFIDYTPSEISNRSDDIAKEVLNKIESKEFDSNASKRGIKIENIRFILK